MPNSTVHSLLNNRSGHRSETGAVTGPPRAFSTSNKRPRHQPPRYLYTAACARSALQEKENEGYFSTNSPLLPRIGHVRTGMEKSAAGAVPESYAKDSIVAWFRGEFAAANAIIDAVCGHLAEVGGGRAGEELYGEAFAAIGRRRMNWFPVINMQRFYSIGEVSDELRRVAEEKRRRRNGDDDRKETEMEEDSSGINGAADEQQQEEDGSEEAQTTASLEYLKLCSDHEECTARPERIKISKGFVAREPVKGHMVNVVKGLKLYEDIFTGSELLRISNFINELRLAGHRGELSGETFIFFNKQMKGNKREIIQLGASLFQPTTEEATGNIEPIPPVIQSVIDHLVQWRLIPDGRKPNSCIINFFDEDEFSQPYFKPPHLDNPICTLVLSETTMAFGWTLASYPNGNYKGSLTLPLKEGSLLVMRGNSADMARHVVCPSANRRVSLSFARVRSARSLQVDHLSAVSPTTTLWQPGSPAQLQKVHSAAMVVPSWGLTLRAPPPVVVFTPPSSRPTIKSPGKRAGREGTGVFLPWTVGPKRYTKHLPPRILKRRLPSLPSPIEAM